MIKVQKIHGFTAEISFHSPQKEFELYWQSFLGSALGKIHQSIPWQGLVKAFKIREYRKGPSRIFAPQGLLALMFLKAYADCSDRKLIEYLNGNIDFQMFCGVFLGAQRITNFKLVSEIRCQLSKKMNIKELQKVLAGHWKPEINHPNVIMTDATCYESSMRYPTNVKLLWESVDWSYHQMALMCKFLKVRMPRNKYLEQRGKYMNYSRKRKKTWQETRVRIRSLLYLLDKLLGQLRTLETDNHDRLRMSERYGKRIRLIRTVLKQQRQIFETGKSVPDRIVSLSKSYIRPIVRGKETKLVEFGAKVNMIQFDGINFIEHLSFRAFHEGIRFKAVRPLWKGPDGTYLSRQW